MESFIEISIGLILCGYIVIGLMMSVYATSFYKMKPALWIPTVLTLGIFGFVGFFETKKRYLSANNASDNEIVIAKKQAVSGIIFFAVFAVTTVVFSVINRLAVSVESSACANKWYLIIIAVLPILFGMRLLLLSSNKENRE